MTSASEPRNEALAQRGLERGVEARALEKRFGATRALAGVSLSLAPGEVHALCGENGAGKSTLIKILAGVYPHGSYEGELAVDGAPARFRGVRDAERAGIAVIHQELALVPELTAAENVYLGDEPRSFGLLDGVRMERESAALFARLGARIDPTAKVASLGVGEAQLVEIARALRKRARTLILDEPTAALSERETAALLEVMRELARSGVALLYVSHRLPEVFAVSDRITVLRDGASVATLRTAETREDELVRHMVGRTLGHIFPRAEAGAEQATSRDVEAARTVLKVEGLSAADPARRSLQLRDIHFELRRGEVLGIGGLVGSGRSELLLHLYGAWGTRLSGSVQLDGAPYAAPSPARSIARGLVLVSEDRKESGLVLEQTAGFNLTLSVLRSLSRRGFVRAHEESEMQLATADRVRLARSRLPLPASALSGGNQQKVVLGRALLSAPRVLLLDEPTRGVDIGAKAEIYELIAEQCRAGMGVLLVTSELPELLGLADRILMLVEGRVGGVFERGEANQERLLRAALPEALPAPLAEEAR